MNRPLVDHKRCPHCNQYLPEKKSDGGYIVYGEGEGYLTLTPEGRRVMMKTMLKEWQDDLVRVCAYIVGQGVKGSLTADDRVYIAAHKLLEAAVDDMPKRIK